MLYDRLYVPANDDLIYHYCSPETLLAICTSKTLRFCDLFSMNDFLELHWGYHIWEQAAGGAIDAVGKEFLDEIDEIIHSSGVRGLALGCCLSTAGDVLSQWRAYAQDGGGYAIGFRASTLARLAVKPLRVSYNRDEQIGEVKKFILALHKVESNEDAKRGPDFFQACAALCFDLAAFKNPAFAEEKEIRLLHLLKFEPSNNFLRIVDAGGTAFDKPVEPQAMQFHMSRGTPVVHMDMDFSHGGTEHPIAEVVLGPKNDSLPTGVSVFLETMGIPNVVIRKSKASYR